MKQQRLRVKGIGFNRYYVFNSEQVQAGTNYVRTYKEWQDLLDGEFGKQIGIDFK